MEAAGVPAGDEESLGELVQRLRLVFDAVAEDPGGSLPVQRFIQMGLRFVQGEELHRVARLLDPQNLGHINFLEFCRGIFVIKGCGDLLDKDLCVEASTRCLHIGDDEGDYSHQVTAVTGFLDCPSGFSDCHLYYSDVTMTHAIQDQHAESDMDSAIESTHNSEASEPDRVQEEGLVVDHLLSSSARCQAPAPAAMSPGHGSMHSHEEQFEDYGQADFCPASPCPSDEIRPNFCSDLSSSLTSSARQTPQRWVDTGQGGADVFCTQCCRRVDLLNELSSRLRRMKANSVNQKLSSMAFGRQLFHSIHSSIEDLFRDSVDSGDNDIAQKVCYLERKVSELENDCLMKGEEKAKLKQENIQLVHRVHAMEEQLREQESRAEETLHLEVRRHRNLLSKLELDKNAQIEALNSRAQHLEEESQELQLMVMRLKNQSQRLDQERLCICSQLGEQWLHLQDEQDVYRALVDRMRQSRQEFLMEHEATRELIDDLHRELDHLRVFQLEMERSSLSHSPSYGLYTFTFRSRELELQHEVKRLRQENVRLQEQNDELNSQILTLSLTEAKTLFTAHTKAQCLASEIDTASRDQLVKALREREEITLRLRQYMDKIILAILDHNPSILEIKK
ncbi:rab11 family-interacting protein 4B [Narcine bancroftii]|uniref:rab11 family-interacting protein 4B n=1 Tax=Narcine bancroftii TaxID=1343680 RepID=UPI0038312707